MLGALGLALLGGPFVTIPSPAYGGDPTLIAIASDPVQMRLPCFSIRCGDSEWRHVLGTDRPELPLAEQPTVRLPGTRRKIGLSAPAVPRDSRDAYVNLNNWRVGTDYDVSAMRDGPLRVGLELGAGYQLAPLHAEGPQQTGPIFRGAIDFDSRFSERAQWTQRIEFQGGRGGEAFVRQKIGLDVSLWPDWTLETDFAIRHDTRNGNGGSETAESSIELRRRF